MARRKIDKVFVIPRESAPRGLRNRVTRRLVEKAVAFPGLDRIIADARELMRNAQNPPASFNDAILRGMGVEVDIQPEDLARIPKTGPVVVVANHPFGGIEGVVFLRILEMVRPDFRVMANYLLGMIPEMRKDFIFVDPFGSTSAKSANMRPLIESMRWLKDGHILGVFPSGEVSSVDLKSRMVRDPAWSPSIAALARKSGATIVPLHFVGRNPAYFQFAGLIHPRLRTVLLPRMTIRRRGAPIQAFVGAPITPFEIKKTETDEELIRLARLRSYSLEGRVEKRKRTLFPRRPRKSAGAPQEEIIAETPREEIEAALAALPKEAFLLSGSGLDVYFTRLSHDSPILREIGRLREYTFRKVGEGTGRKTDLDVFDPHYNHLFLWDPKERRLVGAYRLGLTPDIVPLYGVEGLYTHTLFKYKRDLIDKLTPAIELGRSFVRPEYQRAIAPLMMLWKGIGVFIARHPEYCNLFGPVSITAAYRDASRNMLLRSLSISNFAGDLARLVRPRKPPKKARRAEWKQPEYEEIIGDTEAVSALVQDIESDHKSIPILVKQYVKLGGRILAFNVDPDFSDVVDGLIHVDLRRTDRRTRIRYMGEEPNNTFEAFHHLAADSAAK